MTNGTPQGIRNAAERARGVYNNIENLRPGWGGVAAATAGALAAAGLIVGLLAVDKAWRYYVKPIATSGYYAATGFEKPDIWGVPCEYVREASDPEANVVRGLYRGRENMYRPVLISCDGSRVVDALEGMPKEVKIKAVRLANSRESDITVGGTRYGYAQKGTYMVD